MKNNPQAQKCCAEFKAAFEQLKIEAVGIIKKYRMT